MQSLSLNQSHLTAAQNARTKRRLLKETCEFLIDSRMLVKNVVGIVRAYLSEAYEDIKLDTSSIKGKLSLLVLSTSQVLSYLHKTDINTDAGSTLESKTPKFGETEQLGPLLIRDLKLWIEKNVNSS